MRKNAPLVILVLIVLVVVGILSFSMISENHNNKIAAECLRGNQYACTYWQAQENKKGAASVLEAAKAQEELAREAYSASLNQGGE